MGTPAGRADERESIYTYTKEKKKSAKKGDENQKTREKKGK